MAWMQVKMEDQRNNFINAVIANDKNFSDLCLEYDISRKTGYKWLERYKNEGIGGLCDRSKAPIIRPTSISEPLIHQILAVRIKYPKWGPKKVHAWLKANHASLEWPSPSSIGNIFDRFGLTVTRKLRRRFAVNDTTLTFGENPNDVWSLDFKGTMRTADGSKSDPFTVTDNVSRFLIRCQILQANNGKCVWASLEAAFREYGLPCRILSDNGPPFATAGVGRLSKLSINLIKAGVLPTWITPGKPQQNGRHERMHGTLEKEIESRLLSSQIELGNSLKNFQHYFNFERPHEALDQRTPSDIYVPSTRSWDGILRCPEYTDDFEVRKIQKDGTINLKGTRIFISEALWGESVGLLKGDTLSVHYGPLLLGSINDNFKLEFSRITKKKAYVETKE